MKPDYEQNCKIPTPCEISDKEKIENLQRDLNRLSNDFYKLKAQFAEHVHDHNGKTCVPVES